MKKRADGKSEDKRNDEKRRAEVLPRGRSRLPQQRVQRPATAVVPASRA
jgi:hypothetical protein